MSAHPLTIRSDAEYKIALKLMVDSRIGGLPVVDGDEHVIGVITESDVFRAFVEMQRDGGAVGTGA